MPEDLLIEQEIQKLPKVWDLDDVCNRIAAGESLSEISLSYCKSKQALWYFLNKEEARRRRYLQALEARGIAHLEEIERIALEVENGDLDARSGAVAFQARAWVASRLNPQMLSERWKTELRVDNIQDRHLNALKEIAEIRKQRLGNPSEAVAVDDTHSRG